MVDAELQADNRFTIYAFDLQPSKTTEKDVNTELVQKDSAIRFCSLFSAGKLPNGNNKD